MRTRAFALVLVLLASGACASTGAPPVPRTTPLAAPAEPEAIRWVRDSAEYHAALYQVYRLATARVEAETRTREPGTWAVVLDADETIINNVGYQVERSRLGLGFTPESWNAWVKRREATPLPGASAFLARVRALGGKIAIVTNRLESECEDTAAVFHAHGLPYDAMLCRPDDGPSDKNRRFEAVAAGRTPASSTPLMIVAYVGDNIHDFPSLDQSARQAGAPAFADFGVRYFLVPNPMYGGWQ
jgi:5'-nucleotidase (lipoprotein e(P4) family)